MLHLLLKKTFFKHLTQKYLNDAVKQDFAIFSFEGSFKEIRKAIASLTRLLKKLPLKTPITFFFALHHQLQNI